MNDPHTELTRADVEARIAADQDLIRRHRAARHRVRWFWLARHFGIRTTARWFCSRDFRKGWRGDEADE